MYDLRISGVSFSMLQKAIMDQSLLPDPTIEQLEESSEKESSNASSNSFMIHRSKSKKFIVGLQRRHSDAILFVKSDQTESPASPIESDFKRDSFGQNSDKVLIKEDNYQIVHSPSGLPIFAVAPPEIYNKTVVSEEIPTLSPNSRLGSLKNVYQSFKSHKSGQE